MQQALQLFELWAGEPCTQQMAIGANGSNRKYVRLIGNTRRCMATINNDVRENDTFIYYTRSMRERGLPVPELYAVSNDRRCYLQQDLGDTTLYAYLYDKKRKGGGFDAEMMTLYRQVLDDLVSFQIRCQDLDFAMAYPRSDFDRQSLQWDLNYFKYYFLKLAYIPFDEQLLEEDFDRFIDYLTEDNCSYFLYRDFQARNIMLSDGKLYYIDYQGGRRGAAQYDVASLLYSAKSDLPEPIRQELLHYYVDHFVAALGGDADMHRQQYMDKFYGYVLIRIMQAMGAYGYRGYFERKDYFLKSIPLAVRNLRLIVDNHPLPISLPHLETVWHSIVLDTKLLQGLPLSPTAVLSTEADSEPSTLTVTVGSFSYKKGLPEDHHGNGGGYLFDCRALPNPGRYAEYRSFTGKDPSVIAFLQAEPAVDAFLEHAFALVDASVEKYIERRFTSLTVYFGCTGGQHRSVYCAEQLAKHLRQQYPTVQLQLHHREQV